MMIREKMDQLDLTDVEVKIRESILELGPALEETSTIELARRSFSSPAAIIRFSKKMGFHGWNDFKRAYMREERYLNDNTINIIDVNYPFKATDPQPSIIQSVVSAYRLAINDTYNLLNPTAFKKAVDLLHQSRVIGLFAYGNMYFSVHQFGFLLSGINKPNKIEPIGGEMYHVAASLHPQDCAVVVSYSGETPAVLDLLPILKEQGVPIISITGLGNNDLAQAADIPLYVSTREKAYSKIAPYTSLTSIRLLLDLLYSCLYAMDYEKNTSYKNRQNHLIEEDLRDIDNEIIREEVLSSDQDEMEEEEADQTDSDEDQS